MLNKNISVVFSFILSAVIFFSSFSVQAMSFVITPDSLTSANSLKSDTVISKIPGDANRDSQITAADALIVLQYSVNKIVLSMISEMLCDVNDDGTVSSPDALLILQYSVSLIPVFPCVDTYLAKMTVDSNEISLKKGGAAILEINIDKDNHGTFSFECDNKYLSASIDNAAFTDDDGNHIFFLSIWALKNDVTDIQQNFKLYLTDHPYISSQITVTISPDNLITMYNTVAVPDFGIFSSTFPSQVTAFRYNKEAVHYWYCYERNDLIKNINIPITELIMNYINILINNGFIFLSQNTLDSGGSESYLCRNNHNVYLTYDFNEDMTMYFSVYIIMDLKEQADIQT